MTENRINIDYLPADAKDGVEFSIDAVPGSDVLVPHLRGGGVCEFLFVLRSINAYGADTWQTLANNGFYDDLKAWVRKENQNRRRPDMPEGMQALRIEVTTNAYLFASEADSAQYQIQCKLTYYRKGD